MASEADPALQQDVVLIHCPFWAAAEPPLGLAYLATHLKLAGYRVRVVDLNAEAHNASKTFFERIDDFTTFDPEVLEILSDFLVEAVERIVSIPARLYGLSVNQYNHLASMQLGRRLRARGKTVIMGGPACFISDDLKQIPSEAADYVGIYDGELVLEHLLRRLDDERDPEGMPGLALWRGERWVANRSPRLVPDLNTLALPTFDEFDLSIYTENALPIMLGRGCRGRCAFCNDRSYHHSFREMEAEVLAAAVLGYQRQFKIQAFSFHDAAANSEPETLRRFANYLVDRKIRISWNSNAVIRKHMDDDFVALLRRSGCVLLAFGVESFSNRVLGKMRKGFNVDMAREVFTRCKKHGIDVWINLIIGFPGEEAPDLEKTIAFLEENRDVIDGVLNLTTCVVAPRTDLERIPEDFKVRLPPRGHWRQWYTEDGNTVHRRDHDFDRVEAVVKELSLPIGRRSKYPEDDSRLIRWSVARSDPERGPRRSALSGGIELIGVQNTEVPRLLRGETLRAQCTVHLAPDTPAILLGEVMIGGGVLYRSRWTPSEPGSHRVEMTYPDPNLADGVHEVVFTLVDPISGEALDKRTQLFEYAPDFQILRARLLTDGDEPSRVFHPDGFMNLVVICTINAPAKDGNLTVRLSTARGAGDDNFDLFEHNTPLSGLGFDTTKQGDAEIWLMFDPLRLNPGRYLVEATLWVVKGDDLGPRPDTVTHRFRVSGTPDVVGAMAKLKTQRRPSRPLVQSYLDTPRPLGPLTLLDDGGQPVEAIQSGEAATVEVQTHLGLPDAARLWVGIKGDDRLLFQTQWSKALPDERQSTALRFESFDLMPGMFELEAALADHSNGARLALTRRPLEVVGNDETNGMGLLRLPTVWHAPRNLATPVALHNLELFDAEASPTSVIEPGAAVSLAVWYHERRSLPTVPWVRLFVHTVPGPEAPRILVLSSTVQLNPVPQDTKGLVPRIARLVVDRFFLSPGAYTVTAGIWADDDPSALAMDTCSEPYGLVVGQANQRNLGVLVAMDVDWTCGRPDDNPSKEMGFSRRPLFGEGGDELDETLCPGAPLKVRLDLGVGVEHAWRVGARIVGRGLLVHACQFGEPLTAGRYELELSYRAFNLQQGTYRFIASLVQDGSDDPEEVVTEATFEVGPDPDERNDPTGGLVHCPSRWVIE